MQRILNISLQCRKLHGNAIFILALILPGLNNQRIFMISETQANLALFSSSSFSMPQDTFYSCIMSVQFYAKVKIMSSCQVILILAFKSIVRLHANIKDTITSL